MHACLLSTATTPYFLQRPRPPPSSTSFFRVPRLLATRVFRSSIGAASVRPARQTAHEPKYNNLRKRSSLRTSDARNPKRLAGTAQGGVGSSTTRTHSTRVLLFPSWLFLRYYLPLPSLHPLPHPNSSTSVSQSSWAYRILYRVGGLGALASTLSSTSTTYTTHNTSLKEYENNTKSPESPQPSVTSNAFASVSVCPKGSTLTAGLQIRPAAGRQDVLEC